MGLGILNAESVYFIRMVSESLKMMDSEIDEVEGTVNEGFKEDVALKVVLIAVTTKFSLG
jgi:hypothetical protein